MGMFDLSRFRSQASQLAAKRRQLRSEIEQLKQRREEASVAAYPKEDFIAMLEGVIDAGAARYEDTQLDALLSDMSGLQWRETEHRLLNGDEPPRAKGPPDVVTTLSLMFMPKSLGALPGSVRYEALAYLMGDVVKQALRERVDALPWPETVGTPRAERAAELDKFTKQIRRLEAELVELEAAAAEVAAEGGR